MFLPSAFLATRALLASMIGSGNSTLAARDEVSSFAEFFDLTGEGSQCWFYLYHYYGCTGQSNDPIGTIFTGTWSVDDSGAQVCVGSGVVSSDMCDIASITVDFDGQTVTFYNPVESQLNLESWAQGFANNQTVVY